MVEMLKRSSAYRSSGKMPRWRLWAVLAGLLSVVAVVGAWSAYLASDRMPGELLRYIEKRLYGHNKLEFVAQPVLALVRARVERPVPSPLPTLGKGVQQKSVPSVEYLAGRPLPWRDGAGPGLPRAVTIPVRSVDDLRAAMLSAGPGDVIELAPGSYALTGKLVTGQAGRDRRPITVRAATPRAAELRATTLVAIEVNQPYWVFENLSIVGACAADGDCEHAFHVFGPATATVIRNNYLVDFNAHLKINGTPGKFPDLGLVQFNTLLNTHKRDTTSPVTPVDLVAASGWVVADNLVSNFIKAHGDGISYGIFMKGAGRDGRIERNLVICTSQDIAQAGSRVGTGARVGISVGGGGTGPAFCRDGECRYEHAQAVVANNVVAHCNDSSIDVNRSENIVIAHNTLINTGWIDLRNSPSSAAVYGNWMEGRLRVRRGAWGESVANADDEFSRFFTRPDALDLRWTQQPESVATSRAVQNDFCGRPRGPQSPAGALGLEGLPCRAPGL
jgi:hypothetical protein